MEWIEALFGTKKPIIAMCHLRALPGDPLFRSDLGMSYIIGQARHDIAALQEGGIDGILFSNEFSFPYAQKVEPVTIAAMSRIIGEVLDMIHVPFGIDCMYDAIASIDIAAAVGASFMRSLIAGIYSSDHGLWNTSPSEIARRAVHLGIYGKLKILCSVDPLGFQALKSREIAEAIRSVAFYIRPDGICIPGSESSKLELPEHDLPIFCDGGCTHNNIADFLPKTDGAIVGTALKQNGAFEQSIDAARVHSFMESARSASIIG